MKAIGILLSFVVIILIAVPCCWEQRAEDEQLENSRDHSTNEGSCSPFLSCGSCTGFVLNVETPEFSYFQIPFRELSEQQDESFYSEFVTAIWQPPKLIM